MVPESDYLLDRPVVTLGVEASGEGMHEHKETMLALVRGAKAWWLSTRPHDGKC